MDRSHSELPDDTADAVAAWLGRLRAGDDAAYEWLVRTYGGRMLAVARRLLPDENDAADAVQDAFISAFRSIGAFAGQSQVGTWLHRIVVNACLMKLRGAKNRRPASLDELLPTFDETGHHARGVRPWAAGPVEQLAQAELQAQVRTCIDQLPEGYREILLLRDIEELDTAQAADLLGISPGAVKTRLHRARLALRALLEPLFARPG
ncbi:MAG: sigma-70 family RNA polymerase sigma factor [Pirellulales bacterium]|nr:sigma-70 family RNA polymerase sigma factor [Pirellulales bacterium]